MTMDRNENKQTCRLVEKKLDVYDNVYDIYILVFKNCNGHF